MSFDLAALAKIVWIFVCTLIGLWSAGDILHDKKMEKSFASRFFEALAMVLIWVLMGIATIIFLKYILIVIGVFILISLIKMI